MKKTVAKKKAAPKAAKWDLMLARTWGVDPFAVEIAGDSLPEEQLRVAARWVRMGRTLQKFAKLRTLERN